MVNLNHFILEHVFYEISMLQYTYSELLLIEKRDNRSNVFVESFALHSRNLIDFFLTEENQKQQDDVIAIEYKTKSNSYIKKVEKHRQYLREIKVRSNKELAHLTILRKDGISENKGWDYETIHSVLMEIIIDFINDLSDQPIRIKLKNGCELIGFRR
jgi:hypothetical protein